MKPEPRHSNVPLSPVDRGSTSNSEKHAYTNMQNTPHIYNRPSSRPTMPHFLADVVGGPVMPVEPSEPFGAYLQQYRDLRDEFHASMPFSDFCNMKRFPSQNLMRIAEVHREYGFTSWILTSNSTP